MEDSVPQVQQGVNQSIPQQPDPLKQSPPPVDSIYSKIYPPPRFMSKKTAIILLLIIAAAFIVPAVGYLLGSNKTSTKTVTQLTPTPTPSPTPDPTASWKTYITEVYSIKYPMEYHLAFTQAVDQTFTDGFIGQCGTDCSRINNKGKTFIAINYFTKNLPDNLNTLVNEHTGETYSGAISYSINGFTGFRVKAQSPTDGYDFIDAVLLKNPKGGYIIIQTNAEGEVNFDNMIMTFKFTDQQTNSLCVNEKTNILALVDNFESFQMKKDAVSLFALFTSPISSADADSYNFLSGKKLGVGSGLYNNVTTNFNEPSYKVLGMPTDNQSNGCTINVAEQRSVYNNAGNVGYSPAATYNASLNVLKQNSVWKIDKYYPTGSTLGKYAAWGY